MKSSEERAGERTVDAKKPVNFTGTRAAQRGGKARAVGQGRATNELSTASRLPARDARPALGAYAKFARKQALLLAARARGECRVDYLKHYERPRLKERAPCAVRCL